MKHKATRRFWFSYRHLPEDVQRLADKSFVLMRQDPKHASLHLKKVGRFWSVRVGLHYRALAVEDDNHLVWFWIGSHTDYDKLIG
ncbi:MAG: hypothetical protein ACJ74J_17325 [Blastocatellia bacterium]